LLLRSFARAKEVYDNATSIKDLPKGRMIDLVQEIEFESIRADIEMGKKTDA